MSRPVVPIVLGVLLLGAAACGDGAQGADDVPAQGCGEVVRERLDPDFILHVLPGTEEPDYLTDPPTSGPHAATAAAGGVRDEPLSRPEQVGLLEAGMVLVQHDGSLADADLDAVEGLADDDSVVVAPNPDLPAPVVATAWTRKLLCSTIDGGGGEALAGFAETQAGQGPGSDG